MGGTPRGMLGKMLANRRVGGISSSAAELATGLPGSSWTRFDPAAGRGYRIGNQLVVPAGAGFGGAPAVVMANHGDPSKIFRWKVILHTSLPTGVADPVNAGSGLRFLIRARMENDDIPRTCFVTLDDAQHIYASGRALEVLAFNPNAFELTAHISLDEYVGGLSIWEDVTIFENNLVAETELVFPPFCSRFQVMSPGAAAPAARIRGYAPGGVVVYDDTLAVPRSGLIDRIPDLDYTIAPTGAVPQSHAVMFHCDG